jgi:hypothetical protein
VGSPTSRPGRFERPGPGHPTCPER